MNVRKVELKKDFLSVDDIIKSICARVCVCVCVCQCTDVYGRCPWLNG